LQRDRTNAKASDMFTPGGDSMGPRDADEVRRPGVKRHDRTRHDDPSTQLVLHCGVYNRGRGIIERINRDTA
jgi:hypothetical protein